MHSQIINYGYLGGNQTQDTPEYANGHDIHIVKNCKNTINCLIVIILILMYVIVSLNNKCKKKLTNTNITVNTN